MFRGAVVLLALALSGCMGSGSTDPGPVHEVPADMWGLEAKGCVTATSFFLVEYHQADRFLPSGFQPRDLADFLYYTPPTSGKVPVFVALSSCASMHMVGERTLAGSLDIGFIGFFVRPPALASAYATRPADYDFYTVAYLGPLRGPGALPFQVTETYGWQNLPATVDVDVVSSGRMGLPALPGLPVPERVEALSASGSMLQGGVEIFRFEAEASFPQTFQKEPTLRFWHEGPRGLGWLEFDLPMRTVPAGPLERCYSAPDSIIREVIGHGGGLPCGPDAFALLFPLHDLSGRLHHVDGLQGAAAPAPPPQHLPSPGAAALRVLAPLDVERSIHMPISGGPETGGAEVCHDGAGLSVPANGWARHDGAFITGGGPVPFLRFRDDYQENGCAEARFVVRVPDGASSMTLSFQADRQVESQTRVAVPRALQTFRIYLVEGDAAAPDLEPVACFGEQEVFPAAWPSTRRPQDVVATFDFARCDAATAARLSGSDIAIGFRFQDGGRVQPSLSGMPEGSAAGQMFRATVYAPRVSFDGIELPLHQRDENGLDPGRDVVGYISRGVDVPTPAAGQAHEVFFAIGDRQDVLGLYKRGPGGLERLRDADVHVQEVDGRLLFTIRSDVVAAHGPGGYEVLFAAADTGQVSLLRLPLVAVALLAPLLAAAVAQRNITHVHRLARGAEKAARYVLQGSLLTFWTVYVVVVAYLYAADVGIGMAAWPVPGPSAMAYVLLGGMAAAMVGTAVAARRLELRLVRRELSDLERAQRELERSNRELEQFAYVASHDLKEPLRMVAGYTQLLSMRYGDRLDEKGRGFLGFAAEGASRLQRMVDDLLAYSRVRPNPGGAQSVPLDEAMAAVRLHLKRLIEERHVELRAEPLPTVYGERSQVVQLLLNLVQNAIKFSPQRRPVVEVGASVADGMATVTVRDEGIGIPHRQQERIFQIFQRLHLREEYEGNGIGLAVCKKIVEQFGGRIWVESAPGHGSTFRFTLPTDPMPPRRTPLRARRAGAPVGQTTFWRQAPEAPTAAAGDSPT